MMTTVEMNLLREPLVAMIFLDMWEIILSGGWVVVAWLAIFASEIMKFLWKSVKYIEQEALIQELAFTFSSVL